MEKLPGKLEDIVNVAVRSVDWNSFKTNPATIFHYRYHKNETNFWSVTIHPAVHEVIGGKEDGAFIFPRFSINLCDVMKQFDDVLDISMNSKQGKIKIDGTVGDILCSLTICNCPPKKSRVIKNFNWYTGTVHRKT